MEKEGEVSVSRDWKERLSVSRDLGTGFAAPGGEFTRALYEWSLTPVSYTHLTLPTIYSV